MHLISGNKVILILNKRQQQLTLALSLFGLAVNYLKEKLIKVGK